MHAVHRLVAVSAVTSVALWTVAVAPAMAAPPTGPQSVTLTEGGNWVIPADATNIKVVIKAPGADSVGFASSLVGQPGNGGVGYYLLDDAVAGETLTYIAGVEGGGVERPNYTNARGGQGAAIAIAGDLLAVAGGGGGGGYASWSNLDGDEAVAAGGDGGVAASPGVAVGGDGTPTDPQDRGAGQGGQIASGGAASSIASYADQSVYGGLDGGDTSSATTSVIMLAEGGYGGHVCGSGGGGYTGGAGGTADTFYDNADLVLSFGSAGGGSGFLADDSRIAWDSAHSPSTNAGNGSITVTYTMPSALTASPTSVDGTYGATYSGFPITATGGTGPYTYEVTGGSLPAGLSLNGGTGEISGTPNTVGDSSVTITVTDSALGEKQIQPVTVPFQIAADPAVTAPASATAGDTITISGTGFAPGTYTIELHSEPVTLATVTVDASASFSTSVTIPQATPEGAHSLVVVAGSVAFAASDITVAAAAPVDDEDDSDGEDGDTDELAQTGPMDQAPLLAGIALALLAVGFGVRVAGVRRF